MAVGPEAPLPNGTPLTKVAFMSEKLGGLGCNGFNAAYLRDL